MNSMVYPPGQGKYGELLMGLWRRYLEQYAEQEGNAQGQIVAASYHAAEVFGLLSLTLDRDRKFRSVIDQRMEVFREAASKASAFEDCLVNATFSLYNHFNTLGHQFSSGNQQAEELMSQIDERVRTLIQEASQMERCAVAMRAAFPLLSLMTLVLARDDESTRVIRQVEERFASAAGRVRTDGDHLLNALYRIVEMMQVFTALSDYDLKSQIEQIASRFKEEDDSSDLDLKLRNGFCRLFELGHLVTAHLDAIYS
jgi:hypothetical protein